MLHTLTVLALMGCGTPPTVTQVDPAEVLPGSPIKVLGDALPQSSTVWLVKDADQIQLEDAAFRGPVLLEATVPEQIPPGVWTVQVRTGETILALNDGLTVLAAETEAPCAGTWKANTQLSLARGLVVIDRFHDDGERETLRIPIKEIERVEYELVRLDEETLCSVIYMKRSDGTRVVFDDDTRLNLEPRAYKLGNVMKKPTATPRKDVKDDPRPVEEN